MAWPPPWQYEMMEMEPQMSTLSSSTQRPEIFSFGTHPRGVGLGFGLMHSGWGDYLGYTESI